VVVDDAPDEFIEILMAYDGGMVNGTQFFDLSLSFCLCTKIYNDSKQRTYSDKNLKGPIPDKIQIIYFYIHFISLILLLIHLISF
jgi:hypothetical protein